MNRINHPIEFRFALLLMWIGLPSLTFGQSQFQQALMQGDSAKIRTYIERNPKLVASPLPRTRMVPLHLAIQKGNVEVVELLLKLGAPLDGKNPQKLTAIHRALTASSPQIFDLILERTEDVNVGDRNQTSPLMYSVIYRNDRPENIDRLLAKGANINAVNSSKQTALHLAGYYGRTDCGLRLIRAGADLSAVDNQGATPFLAACSSSPEMVAELLARGVDPLIRNRQGQTALHLACQSNQAEVAKLVIGRFQDVDLRDNQSQTPLLLAIYRNNSQLAELLLKQGADPNNDVSSQEQNQPDPAICYAAKTGNQELLKILIEGGANVNVQDREGESPLHLAASAGAGMFGSPNADSNVGQGFVDSIKLLIQHNADINDKNKTNETPIEVAAKTDFFEAVELLVNKSDDLDFDLGESSLFHWSAKNGLVKMMTRLIANQKEPTNSKDSEGRTPIHLAAENGHLKVVELLIKSDAEVDSTDDDGLTALMQAAAAGHADVVQSLINAKADVSKKDLSGQSALHQAAWVGADEVVDVLLSTRDGSDVKTQTGYTPLHAAAWNGHASVVKRLLVRGADVNAADSDGWTPLHKAAFRGHVDAVKELLERGADKTRVSEAGLTPLSMAQGNKKTDVVALLQ